MAKDACVHVSEASDPCWALDGDVMYGVFGQVRTVLLRPFTIGRCRSARKDLPAAVAAPREHHA